MDATGVPYLWQLAPASTFPFMSGSWSTAGNRSFQRLSLPGCVSVGLAEIYDGWEVFSTKPGVMVFPYLRRPANRFVSSKIFPGRFVPRSGPGRIQSRRWKTGEALFDTPLLQLFGERFET